MSGEPLRPGDPVTLVLPDHVVMVEAHTCTKGGFCSPLTSRSGKTIESRWSLSDEGVGWIRGYHLADSPEVAACRTAQALVPQETKRDAPTPTASPHGLGSLGNISGGGGGGASVIVDIDAVAEQVRKRLRDEE